MHKIIKTNAAGFAVLVVLALSLVATGTASADPASYFSQVANSLKTNPVYVDSKASPSITGDQAGQLSNQIKNTKKGIYLIMVDNDQIGSTGPEQLPNAVHAALGKDGVYAVSSKGGFYAQGFNVPSPVADQADDMARKALDDSKAANGGKAVPVDVFTRYVKYVDGISVPSNSSDKSSSAPSGSRSSSSSTSAPASSGTNWALIIGVLVGIIVVIGMSVSSKRRKREEDEFRTRRERSLKSNIGQIQTDLYDLEDDVTAHPEARDAYSSALNNASRAAEHMKEGDVDTAQEAYDEARRQKRKVEDILNPAPKVQDTSHYGSTTRRDSTPVYEDDIDSEHESVTSGGARVRKPDGTTVVINNNTYTPQTQYTQVYPHHFGGGYVGGVWYGPGYYRDPFWDYVLLDAMIHDDHHHYHDDHGRGGDSSYERVDSDVGGDSWGETSESYNEPERETGDVGGGSWEPDPEPIYSAPEPSYSSPSYDPPSSDSWGSSSSSSDWGGGGGFDSGSSSGDSGGGGW